METTVRHEKERPDASLREKEDTSEGLAVAKSKLDSLGTEITVTLKIVERSSTAGWGKAKNKNNVVHKVFWFNVEFRYFLWR